MTDQSGRLRTMDDIPLDGKRVLVRVDFNVAVGDDGKVDASEDYRIETALPTIEELQQRRCKVLLLTHAGRPRESRQDTDLTPIRLRLQELLKDDVRQAPELYGQGLSAIVDGMEPGQVVLLPNVRLDAREEAGNQRFARELAQTADAYVNESFSADHRAHSSVVFLPQELLSCAGRRTVIEVERLSRLRDTSEKPYVAIVGGAKITTKLGMIHDLLSKVDALCIGGQMANIFVAALGKYPTDKMAVDDIVAAQYILEHTPEKLVLPVDFVIGDETGSATSVVGVEELATTHDGLYDIGPQSLEIFLNHCRTAKTIMWNGPVGRFEIPAYAAASHTLAREIAKLSAYRVVGGGNTVNILEAERVVDKYDHVSIGGGAMVEFLEGKPLPGLTPLYD